MQTTYDTITILNEVTYQKYGTHAYAAGYFSSMVSGMIDEMRTRGTKDTLAMADYYDRLLSQSIIKTLTEK